MEKVSIIIPAYNLEAYIKKSVLSCIEQSYKNIEIIIVDDGSTDNTWNIIYKMQNLFNNVVAIHKENGGVSSARNLGINNATGDYIVFLDGDDWLEKDAISYLVNHKNDNESLICCDRNFASIVSGAVKITPQVTEGEEQIYKNIVECLAKEKANLQSACYKLFQTSKIEGKISFKEDIYHGEDGLFVYEYLNSIKAEPVAEK